MDPTGRFTVHITNINEEKITLIDPTLQKVKDVISAQPDGSIVIIELMGHGSRHQLLIGPGASTDGMVYVPGINDKVMFSDGSSVADLLKPKLARGGSLIDLNGCNTARQTPFIFDNNHITKQLSTELPGTMVVGNMGFGFGNELSFPFNRDHYIRFGREWHVFRVPRVYQNGKEKWK